MSETEPQIPAGSQPPETLYKAVLTSSAYDTIPIDNHRVKVFQFEDSGSLDVIEITDKAKRMWLIQDDPRIHETLGHMGCKMVCKQSWDESFARQYPPHVTSGGEWDVWDENQSKSLVLEMEKLGRLANVQPSTDHLGSFEIPIEFNIVTRKIGDYILQMHDHNTLLVEIEEFPEMSHILVEHGIEGDAQPFCIFEEKELMDELWEKGYDRLIKRYPTGQIVKAFIERQRDGFDHWAAELLDKKD